MNGDKKPNREKKKRQSITKKKIKKGVNKKTLTKK
jgi:hypothetical protein